MTIHEAIEYILKKRSETADSESFVSQPVDLTKAAEFAKTLRILSESDLGYVGGTLSERVASLLSKVAFDTTLDDEDSEKTAATSEPSRYESGVPAEDEEKFWMSNKPKKNLRQLLRSIIEGKHNETKTR